MRLHGCKAAKAAKRIFSVALRRCNTHSSDLSLGMFILALQVPGPAYSCECSLLAQQSRADPAAAQSRPGTCPGQGSGPVVVSRARCDGDIHRTLKLWEGQLTRHFNPDRASLCISFPPES